MLRKRTSQNLKTLKVKILPDITLFLLVIFFLNCSRSPEKQEQTIASINSYSISINDFSDRFQKLKNQLGLPDNLETRQKVLQSMIDEELWIQEARARRYDRTAEFKKHQAVMTDRILLDMYSRDKVLSSITVSDAELKEQFTRFNTQVTARHLLVQTFAQAEEYRKRLMKGETYQELAKEVFRHPELRKSGGIVGPFSADEMEPVFEEAAFTLPVNEISQPVKLEHGYSVIKVLSRTSKPVLTEYEFSQKRKQIEQYLLTRKRPGVVKSYVDSIRTHVLDIVFEKQAAQQLFKELQAAANLESNPLSALKNKNKFAGSAAFFTCSIGNYSLGDVIALLDNATEKELGWMKSPVDLENLVSGLMVRSYMLKQARKAGMHKTATFREELRKEEETYLLEQLRENVLLSTAIPEDSLVNFYSNNPDLFRATASVRLRGILLDDPAMVATVEQKLNSGNDFQDLARTYSIHKESASLGGDLGYFRKSKLGSKVKSVWNLKKGEWIGPVEMEGIGAGFFQVSDRTENSVPEYDSIRAETLNEYRNHNRQQLFRVFSDSLRKEATIQVFRDRLLEQKNGSKENRI